MKSEVTAMPMIAVRLSNDAGDTDALNLSPVVARALRDRLNEALEAFEGPVTAEAEGEDERLLLPTGFKPWPVDKGGNSLLPPSTKIEKIVMIVPPDYPYKPQATPVPLEWLGRPVETSELFAYKPAEVNDR